MKAIKGLKLFSLEGKVALITGGAQGIGLALTKGLATAGATVAVNARSQQHLDAARQECTSEGIALHTYLCDVTDRQAVAEMIGRIEGELGSVDILVNNAAIIKRIAAMEMSLEEWQQVIDTDLTAPFLLSKAVAPGMKARGGGKIINLCSMMSEVGRDTVAAYAAAKGGLKMLTRNLATEWARHNIQVNGIGPGYIATSQNAALREPEHPFDEFILRRTPAMRWGRPVDLVGGAIFLASAASDFVNGHILYIDGGILASLGKASHEE